MKYLNRQRLGIEAFLAARSNIFSRHNELGPDELIARLRVQSYAVRSRVAQDVKNAIKELTSGKYDTAALIPSHIAALCDEQCNPERVGKMRPFFAWLQSLWRDNDQARSEWISQLKTVARNLGTASGDCLMAVSTGYNNQRVLIESREDGSLELSLHERRWGRLSISFPRCEMSTENSVPALGFMYILEGEVIENDRYRFEILLDTEFSAPNDTIRALRPTAWKQVSFTCDAPRAQLSPINYTAAADIRGASKLETVRYASEVLCEKASLAGDSMLSAAERTALPMARLISASKNLHDKGKKGDIKSEDTLIELADNRFAFERMAELFEKEKAEPVAKLMQKAISCMDNEDIDSLLRTLRKFPALTDELCSHGELMPLMVSLRNTMLKAGECEEAENSREAVFRAAAKAFETAVEPHISKMGFSGEYPHYRRIRHGKAEYISAIVEKEPEALDGGNLSYAFMLCAAQTKMKRAQRKAGTIRGISFSESCATDFFNERPEYSNSGVIDCACEPSFVTVSVDILSGEATVDGANIPKMLKCAKRAFNGFALKRRQRRIRKQHTDKKERRRQFVNGFIDALSRFALPSTFMCAVVAGLYLWGRTQFEVIENISIRVAIFPIAYAGLFTAALCALIYCLRRKRKLWIY